VKQLLQRSPAISQDAKDLYAQCHEKRETQPSLKEVLQLLNTEMGRVSSLFIVLDALDECTEEGNTRAKVILELEKIPNVRLMITGRRDVEEIVLSKCKYSITTLNIQASSNNIPKAIETQVHETLDLSKTKHSSLSVVEKIATKAQGMYNSLLHQASSNKPTSNGTFQTCEKRTETPRSQGLVWIISLSPPFPVTPYSRKRD
jgi:hypothetical protein